MCDGIPDVMSNEEAIFELDYVREAGKPQDEVKAACGQLVQAAYKKGSQDNLTVLLARLQWMDVDPKVEAAKAAAKAADAAKAAAKSADAAKASTSAAAPATKA